MKTLLIRIIREPLLHFLFAAGALFVLFSVVNNGLADDDKTIIVSRDDLLTFMQYRARAFDAARFEERFNDMGEEEKAQWIADYAKEEALYREAKALGLDRNDYVARRRLIQQLEFITQGFAEAGLTLTDDEVAAYYEANKDKYAEPAKITFTHVFYSHDRHGAAEALRLAQEKLETLQAQSVPFHEAPAHGDRPLYHVNYVRKEADLVASHFGDEMAAALFALSPSDQTWRGPFRSPFGVHLALVTGVEQAFIPGLEEVKSRVAADALSEKQRQRLEQALDAIVETYDIAPAEDINAPTTEEPAAEAQGAGS